MSDNLPPLPEFEKWLRSVCFQAPPSHAYDLARCAWIEAGRASLEASRAAVPADLPEIDYEALIKAAHTRDKKWAQGTNGCIAFKHGAEWYRSTLLAAPQPVAQPGEQSAFEDWLQRVCPSGDVTEVQRQWEASSDLAEWLESQAKPEQAAQPAGQLGLIEEQLDAARFRALCADHEDRDVRSAVRDLIDRLPVMSLSAARQDIDAVFSNKALDVAPPRSQEGAPR